MVNSQVLFILTIVLSYIKKLFNVFKSIRKNNGNTLNSHCILVISKYFDTIHDYVTFPSQANKEYTIHVNVQLIFRQYLQFLQVN